MLPEQLFLTLPPLLPQQDELQPPVPTVLGSIDYRTWRQRLERIDEILRASRVEEAFLRVCLKRHLVEGKQKAEQEGRPDQRMCEGDQILFQRICSVALRATLARTLTGDSFRDFAARLADSSLLQWFCRLSRLDQVRIPGKSQLQLYQEMVSESELREVVSSLMDSAAEKDSPLELEEPLDLETQFLDSTCVELNIHYPTDWVLLRDAVRTLMKATTLIRKRGLKVRMKEPEVFLRWMNRLSMQMTKHARRHRDLLEKRWEETDLSRGQARQIIDRMDTILERLPYAVKQAHERIIGERQVANEEKILSLYEGHAAVYVRGKAGAEVEFGSQLLLAEAECGLITDWELVCGDPEHDTVLLKRSLERDGLRRVKTVVGDRGFDSKLTRELLAGRGIVNAIAPRDAGLLRARLREVRFQQLHQRRGQTEARIAIFKNAFLGAPLVAKGHENQARLVAWNVLTHNLSLLSGLPQRELRALRQAS